MKNKLKQIPEFPEYDVSTSGQIWSRRKNRWMRQIPNPEGYKMVTLYGPNGRKGKSVHRLVLEVHSGPCPEGMQCRHLDGDKANNNISNLRWGTGVENMQDRIKHGSNPSLGAFGEKGMASKISDQDRRMIIYEYSTGLFTQEEIAQNYGIHRTTVSLLMTGKCYPFCKAVKEKTELEGK